MAAIVPTSIRRCNWGSDNVVIATFSTVSDGDTWASGAPAIASKWVDMNGDPSTQGSAGFASVFSGGTFTFYPGENSLPFRLHFVIE